MTVLISICEKFSTTEGTENLWETAHNGINPDFVIHFIGKQIEYNNGEILL